MVLLRLHGRSYDRGELRGVSCCRDEIESQLAKLTKQKAQMEAALQAAEDDLHAVTEDR